MGVVTYIENIHVAVFYEDSSDDGGRLEEFCERLDSAIQRSLDRFSDLERLIISLILKGYKKSDISKACFVSASYVSEVRNRFVRVLSDNLSDELGVEVTEVLIEMYLKEIKSYTLLQKRWWDQWMRYREESERQQREKFDRELLNEIMRKGGKV